MEKKNFGKRYPDELRARAVRMALDHESEYRKLHDDLVELGETSCPNRVARLARLAGIRA